MGKYITAFGVPIKIVGVLAHMEKSDTISISNPDEEYNNAIVVPTSIFKRLFGGDGKYFQLLCKAYSMDNIPEGKKEILKILAGNHGKWDDRVDKFMIIGMQEQLDMINKVVGTVTVCVAVLAGIALLVAAFSNMLSLVTGLLSGFYPSIRASKLIPHEALRYE